MSISTIAKLIAIVLIISYGSAAIGWSLGKAVQSAAQDRTAQIEEATK